MKQPFIEFITSKFTLTVFISLIVFRFFDVVLDEFISPTFNLIVDPQNELGNKKFTVGSYNIEYGKSLRYTILLFLVLVAIYYFFRTK